MGTERIFVWVVLLLLRALLLLRLWALLLRAVLLLRLWTLLLLGVLRVVRRTEQGARGHYSQSCRPLATRQRYSRRLQLRLLQLDCES